jgi:hypothetical protein
VITHATPTGWQIIYQRAHALLAMQIAYYWLPDQRPQRWIDLLAAIAQHDDGGSEWEGKDLLTPAGAPKDFKLGDVNLNKPVETVKHAGYQSRYIALLQSMHFCNLYKDFADQREIADFLKQQVAQQGKWREALGMSEADADRDYRLLYLADTFSLVLCQRQLPTDGRHLEIGSGPDETVYYARRCTDAGGSDPRSAGNEFILTVEPWPFEASAFDVSVETTLIEGLTFAGDDELMDAIEHGHVETITWHVAKS